MPPVTFFRLDDQNNSSQLIDTAGVLDFLGCAWWPSCPPLGMYYVEFLICQ